jgi:hypothetical protein|tara:strand:- start:6288 stop:6920 length:633 start_codon:yes stop_codon:yes gene_type:complete
MSGQLTTNYFEAVDITSVTKTRITETLSNKQFRRSITGQYYRLGLKTFPMKRTDFDALLGFLKKQNGRFDNFDLTPPIISVAQGTLSGNVISGSNTGATTGTSQADAGQTTFNLQNKADGSPATGTLLAGTYIKFSNHDKVYCVTDTVTFDGSSVISVNIFPNLVSALPNGTDLVYTNVPFKVILETDELVTKITNDGFHNLEFSVREDI